MIIKPRYKNKALIYALRAFQSLVFFSCSINAYPASLEIQRFNQLQAAYIYNIARYVEWPDRGSESPVDLCIVEPKPRLSEALRAGTRGKSIQNRSIQVKSVNNAWLQDNRGALAEHCHLIYVDYAQDEVRDSIPVFNEASVMWGTSPKWNAMSGAVFQLRVENGRIVIYIDRAQLNRSGFVLGAPLLAVVKVDP